MKKVMLMVELPEKEEKCWECRFLDINYHCLLFDKTIRIGFGGEERFNRLDYCLEIVKEN